jgi:hypothetical protein
VAVILLFFPGQSPSAEVRGWSTAVVNQPLFKVKVAVGLNLLGKVAEPLFAAVVGIPAVPRGFVRTDVNPFGLIGNSIPLRGTVFAASVPTAKVLDYGVSN